MKSRSATRLLVGALIALWIAVGGFAWKKARAAPALVQAGDLVTFVRDGTRQPLCVQVWSTGLDTDGVQRVWVVSLEVPAWVDRAPLQQLSSGCEQTAGNLHAIGSGTGGGVGGSFTSGRPSAMPGRLLTPTAAK